MSGTETFDNWYKDLSSDDKEEIISHILESYTNLTYATEGYHAGPSGEIKMVLDGIHAGPSGKIKPMSATASSNKKCPCCGR